jgi:2,3-dihydroxyphenylpropionate 1,2-dioxygenase
MLVGALCMSHSPLIDKNRASAEVERRFDAAIDKAAQFVSAQRADLIVIFYPDHIDGFFYNLLPSFCVGIQGESIGDYGTAAGRLDIPEAVALDCAASVIAAGVDTAISYKMDVDHGAVQPIELMSAKGEMPPFIPIFVNCAAPPRPSFQRARALGEAVGRWARARPERILVLGSGGLSHDPPVPEMRNANPETRARLIEGGPMTHRARIARHSRSHEEGNKLAAGTSSLRPVNTEWDKRLLDAVKRADLGIFDNLDQDELTERMGRGGHEIRTWLAALSALRAGGGYKSELLFYEPVLEWLTGMGILTAVPEK